MSKEIGSASRKPSLLLEPQMSILAMRHRFIVKDLLIMPVVKNSVVFKYLFESW